MAKRAVCLHGHFYQPPRENPWIEEVEVQDSAAPFHDWNQRITAECYGPNGAARLKNAEGRIVDIVNNYVHLSFNFGPTLLAWLERQAPEVYRNVLEADARSVRERGGHGNALAQAYNHTILPLCNDRDLRTQIRWGVADFRHRFRREPEGIWLPETAADLRTLQAIHDEGLRFTLLSPYQCTRVRAPGAEWQDAREARFDPARPYRVMLPSGAAFPVFFYDGPIARAVAFGEALHDGDDLVRRIEAGFSAERGHDEVLSIAVDGETFGHHRKGGDEVLAAAIRKLSRRVELMNLAQALERFPPDHEAEIVGGASSWSCAHGVERWRADCGCRGDGQPGWRQHWRAPLREALDGLRDRLAALFEREASKLLRDPWRARDEFIEVVLDPERRNAAAFVSRHALREPAREERVRALQLLEMQRQAMLMYTSCGWFFSEVSGLETVQILKYAARALQLAHEASGAELETQFKEALERAPSNLPEYGDGRRVYELCVQPSIASLETVAAHYAIAGLVEDFPRRTSIFCHEVQTSFRRREDAGTAALSLARIEVRSKITQEQVDLITCVLHFSGADFRCGVRDWSADRFARTAERLFEGFHRLSLAQVVREIDREFTGRDYTLRDLFLDERREVAGRLLRDTMAHYESDYRQIYERNRRLIEFLREIDSPVPRPLQVAADVALTHQALEIARGLAGGRLDPSAAQTELLAVAQTAGRLGARIDLAAVRGPFHAAVGALFDKALAGRREAALQAAELIALGQRLEIHLDLWAMQNALWSCLRRNAWPHDRDTLARLAHALWLDAGALLRRLEPQRATA